MKHNILQKNDTKLVFLITTCNLTIVMLRWLLFKEHYYKPLEFLLFQHFQIFVTTTLYYLYKMTTPFRKEKDVPLFFSFLWHTINLSPFVNYHMKSMNEVATFYRKAINNITTIGDCLKTHQKMLGKTKTQKEWHKKKNKEKLKEGDIHAHTHTHKCPSIKHET